MPTSTHQTSHTIIAVQFELLCQREMEAAGHECTRATSSDFESHLNVYNAATARWLAAVAVAQECRRQSAA